MEQTRKYCHVDGIGLLGLAYPKHLIYILGLHCFSPPYLLGRQQSIAHRDLAWH